MKKFLLSLFTSKKFIATVAGIVVSLVAKVGLDLPVEHVLGILGAVAAYVLGQGLADTGKEAAKINKEES